MKITDVNQDAVGMDGIDPVAFRNGEPLRGKPELNYTLFGEKYLFSSEANLETFQNDPERYIPKAGGHLSGIAHTHNTENSKSYIGNKTFINNRDLEDVHVSHENNVPMDMKEDGSVEMQNLSDSDK